MGKDVRRDIANRDLGRALGRKIARLERHLRELETASQAAFRSVEDGALDFYDDDGVLRERIGKQADGSWGRVVKEGPIPPAPTEPDVQVISDGVVAITWDGRTEEKWPIAEFRMVRVHLGETEDFTPDRDNQVGAIWAARGGTIVAVTESDDDNPVWVKLAAVSTAGHWTESAAVLVDELDEDDLEEEQEELEWEDGDGHTLTSEDIAAGTVTFGLSHIPEQKSLILWWRTTRQEPAEYTVDYEAATVTFPLSSEHAEGDRLSTYYAYYEGGTFSNVVFESGIDNPVTVPGGATSGDLMILMIALPTSISAASALNGYTLIGQTASVTHGVSPFDSTTLTYRLAIYARSAPSGTIPVPTFPADAQDTPWVMAAFRGAGTSVTDSAFSTTASAATGTIAALAGADIQVWATISRGVAIVPEQGQVAATNGGVQIDIAAVTDAGDGPVTAHLETDLSDPMSTAGWLMAALKVGD